MEEYIWREVGEGELGELEALDEACVDADGPASVVWDSYSDLIASREVAMLCARPARDDEHLVAVGWARLSMDRAWLGGKVHPKHRRKGLGTYLLRWTEKQAGEQGRPESFNIRNEAVSEGSAALYSREGYDLDFAEEWMQRNLTEPLPQVEKSFATAPWTPESSMDFFKAYLEAFRERRAPGSPEPDAGEWISDNAEDPDFRPDLSMVAYDGGKPVGFLTAAVIHVAQLRRRVGWISQVGSDPAWRGRGVAAAMIAATMEAFKREGLDAVGLHVNTNNPHAIKLYERLGFNRIGRRARYSKPAR
jgi:ribosomal protein S18 acetylase RimI-like enzyme